MEINPMYKKKKNRWSMSKIELLIDLWAEHYRQLKSCRRNDHVLMKMKNKLEKSGCKVTVEDIRIRINNLSAKYRKESMLMLAGGSPSKWPLFVKIHNILSNESTLDETVETQDESLEAPEPPPEPPRSKVYQLKCNYRQENIDNFFTDLYFNPRYADVTLVTCYEGETFAIPAHKMVLGNFSMYFANIFEKLNLPQNSNTYIVLPANVSHQTMQILMQYMYTGQSSVPEYNVDEVLRCGELLKIRGFWSETKASVSGAGLSHKRRQLNGPEGRKMHRKPGTSSQGSGEPRAGTSLPADQQSEVASDSGTSALDTLDEQKRLAIAAIQRDLHASSMRAMAHGAAALFSNNVSTEVKHESNEWDDLDGDNDSDEDVMILPDELTAKPADGPDEKPNPSAELAEQIAQLQQQQQQQQHLLMNNTSEQQQQQQQQQQTPPQQQQQPQPQPQLHQQSHSSSQQQPSATVGSQSAMACELCSACFSHQDELLQHLISSHSDAAEILRKRSRLATDEENPVNAIRCEFCGKYFFSTVEWAQHVHTHTERAVELPQQMAQFSGTIPR
ncbi:protein bric-a-brac 1-like [Anopheles aquasalis]|uniref:protein bric-a-brac 1-like n=1 Tax=Anopheles aquasalis TaxID=42839 RepID=UPI00215ADE33|nr:protein bric-a-brac 1-like [Anopheles aquasalis]